MKRNLSQLARRVRDEFFPAKDSFDKERGTNTSGRVSRFRMYAPFAARKKGTGYQAITETEFAEAMRVLPPDVRNHTFIDLGCGKGRALLLAKEYGFKSIIGVEFSPSLARIARKNAASIPEITVYTEDASTFVFPRAPLLIFLHNPFGASVLQAVMENIRGQGLSGFIAYVNPVHDSVLGDTRLIDRKDRRAIREF